MNNHVNETIAEILNNAILKKNLPSSEMPVLDFLDLLARNEGLVMLYLMPDGELVNLVRAIDPMSWQWRHRAGIVTLLHELADRLAPVEDTANAAGQPPAARTGLT